MKQIYNYLFRFKKLNFKERLAIRKYFEKYKIFELNPMSLTYTLGTFSVMMISTGIFFSVEKIGYQIFFGGLSILSILLYFITSSLDVLYTHVPYIIFEENNILNQKRRFINIDLKNIDVLIYYFFEKELNNPVLNVFEFKNGLYLLEYIELIKQDPELSKLIISTNKVIKDSKFNNVPEEVQKKVIEQKVIELLVKANEKIKLYDFLTIDKSHIEKLNEESEKLKMSNEESDRLDSHKYKLKADRLLMILKTENIKKMSKLIDDVFSNENNLNPKYNLSDKIHEILGEQSPKLIENTVTNYNSDYFLNEINKVRELVN